MIILVTELLESFKAAMEKRLTAEEELAQQRQNQDTAEMKAKYKECREAEGQLRDIEERLGEFRSWVFFHSK